MADIKPALSAEEWTSGSHPLDGHVDAGTGVVDVRIGWHSDLNDPPREWFALMALANAALPDGDPRKLTWQDVDRLLGADVRGEESYDHMISLANRIAALLPPREQEQ